MFNGGNPEIEVTIHKHKSKAGIYMVEEMYGWPFLTEFFGGSQEAIESQVKLTYTPVNITIDCSDPTKVVIPRQFTGITDGDPAYGDYEIAMFPGGEGTLVNGVNHVPQEALAFVCSAGNLKANKSGLFRILLPDAELTDYTLSAVYDGMKVSADGETASAVINFTYGADVTNIRYVLVENELTEAETATLVAAIADGSAENINEFQDFTVGGEKVSAEAVLPKAGTYTVVALPLNKAQKPVSGEASAASFYFPGIGGASVPNDIAGLLYKVSRLSRCRSICVEVPRLLIGRVRDHRYGDEEDQDRLQQDFHNREHRDSNRRPDPAGSGRGARQRTRCRCDGRTCNDRKYWNIMINLTLVLLIRWLSKRRTITARQN